MEEVEQIYLENSDRVYRYIYLVVRHKETAEDLTQEAFYKAYKNIHTFNNQSSVATWLLKIARNVTYDHLRRKKVVQFFALSSDNDRDLKNPSPEKSTEKKEDAARLHEALNRLKKAYRDVLILRKIDECSIKETAYILGWTEAKVKTMMARALVVLKKELDEKDGVMHGSIKRT
ncbi:RNA polymerase sigma factor [Planococcus sp. YIM B11945]|uniref:RNA polymerase sigma factor n=1 Tax=Planococcus sp. YIM B11945 TaxID=3435410 RepID=UPI003D7EBE9F